MMDRVAETNKIYLTAGLKGRKNSMRIKLGRKPKRRSLKMHGRGAWSEDKFHKLLACSLFTPYRAWSEDRIPIFILVQRGGREECAL